jgi:hypothetical protein
MERRGDWWLRLSIDTEHLGRPEEALEVCLSICLPVLTQSAKLQARRVDDGSD